MGKRNIRRKNAGGAVGRIIGKAREGREGEGQYPRATWSQNREVDWLVSDELGSKGGKKGGTAKGSSSKKVTRRGMNQQRWARCAGKLRRKVSESKKRKKIQQNRRNSFGTRAPAGK